MNKATAKYLPVEGELVKGCKTTHGLYNGSYGSNSGERAAILYGNDGESLPILTATIAPLVEDIKPVKLFAVTHDIEVGDEIYHKLTQTRCICLEIVDRIVKDDQGVNKYLREYSKVLGELSPNAIWVKEGEEIELQIEDGELMYWWFDNNGNSFYRLDKNENNRFIKVLGPCGHYH